MSAIVRYGGWFGFRIAPHRTHACTDFWLAEKLLLPHGYNSIYTIKFIFVIVKGWRMFRTTCALIKSSFTNQARHTSHQYQPKKTVYRKAHKGKVPIPSGGSTKGTTIQIGEYGLRLKNEGKRFSAKQLQTCEAVIRRVIKVQKGARAYLRPACNIAVCKKGNETRMGKGKGEFDHWAVRVPIGRIVWEIGGASEEIAREAFRQAGNKLPGIYEFVKRGAPPVMGRKPVDLTTTEMVENQETGEIEMVR